MNDSNHVPPQFEGAYSHYAPLHAGGPVQRVTGGSGDSYLVTGYDEARRALADPRLSKDTGAFFAGRSSGRDLHPAISRSMLATDPPEHARLRKLVTKAFTTKAVDRLRPCIQQITDVLLDQWAAGADIDAVASLAVPLPVTVISELLGVPEADRPDLRRWSADLFAAEQPATIDAASHAVAGCMTDLIAAKRRRPGDSLLDDLIGARDGDDRLSEKELVSLAALLLVAGHETTADLLGNALLALLLHPDELSRLRGNPAEIPDMVDELLRFDSPVSNATFRYTTEDVALGGVDIPAGVPVLIALGAANRDPKRFASPDSLDPRRGASGHLGFGHGIHRCVGAPLARTEAEIALRTILARFPAIRLAVPPGGLNWRRTRLVRGLVSLPVRV